MARKTVSFRARAARNLIYVLRTQGNTVADIARLVGVSEQSVYGWLRGNSPRNGPLLRLRELAEPAVTDEDRAFIDTLTQRTR